MKYSVQNPVLRGFNPDPCIIYVDGTYYIATSTFEYYPGVKISASEDLANWRTVSYPLNRLELLDMRGDAASTGIWAPALSYADGMFWLIFTELVIGLPQRTSSDVSLNASVPKKPAFTLDST